MTSVCSSHHVVHYIPNTYFLITGSLYLLITFLQGSSYKLSLVYLPSPEAGPYVVKTISVFYLVFWEVSDYWWDCRQWKLYLVFHVILYFLLHHYVAITLCCRLLHKNIFSTYFTITKSLLPFKGYRLPYSSSGEGRSWKTISVKG